MRAAIAASFAAGVLAVLLAGCGSSTHASVSSTSTLAGGLTSGAQTATLQRARVAAASCMRAQGIDIPDPGIGQGSVLAVLRILGSYPSVKIQAAEKACATQIGRAFPNATSLTPGQRAVRQREGLAFAACMRSHGIAFPDPSSAASDPAAYYQALGSFDINSPAFKSAMKTCTAVALNAGSG